MSGPSAWKAKSDRQSTSSTDSKPPSTFSHEGPVVQTRQTRICKYYRGPNGCERGERCPFTHDVSPDETTPKTITFVGAKKHSDSSTPREDSLKPCWAFQKGNCSYGEQCKYSHSPAAICVYFRNGKCTWKDCKFRHDDGKTLERVSPQPWRRSGTRYPEKRNENQTNQTVWRRNSVSSTHGKHLPNEDMERVTKKGEWKFDKAKSDKPRPNWSDWRRGSASQESSQTSGPSDWSRGSIHQEPRIGQKNQQKGHPNFSGRAAYEWEDEDSDSSSDDGILEMSIVSAAWVQENSSLKTQLQQASPQQLHPSSEVNASVFANWRNQLRLTTRGTSDSAELRSFWENAIKVFEDPDSTLRQKLIELLLQRGDHGKKRIAKVTQTNPGKNEDIVENSYPFLVFATLPQLVESPIMEYHANTLYKIVYDSDEKKCLVFLEELASRLTQDQPTGVLQLRSNEKDAEVGIHIQALIKVAEFLRQLLKRNMAARFNDGLVKVVDSLLEFVSHYHVESQDLQFRQARATLRVVKTICHNPSENLNTISTFINDRDLPGKVCSEGPRHDNDHARIEDIKILPTLDEIQSQRRDFLPRKDQIDKRFLEGAKRLADTNFRLLRYDYIKLIRDIVSVVLRQLKLPEPDREKALSSPCPKNLRYYLYRNPDILSRPRFDQTSGMQFTLKFDHPLDLQKRKNGDRQKWWDAKKRLERGTLVCLVTSNNSEQDIHFLMIVEKETDPGSSITLSGEEYATVLVQPAEPTDAEAVKKLLEHTKLGQSSNVTALIEFPKCLPETFIPILSTLQDLSVTGKMPFEKFLVHDSSEIQTILPPAYAREADFEFDLSPIMSNWSSDCSTLSPGKSSDNSAIIAYLEDNTSLDHGQSKGLIAALTQEISLLQGPPGTGKSYLGLQIVRILLESCPLKDIGPIVCVCYTNHALDQFLEELLDKKITDIVRIGGRSSSERLAEKNLRNISRNFGYSEKTFGLSNKLQGLSKSLKTLSLLLQEIGEGLAGDPSCWNSLRCILEYYYPNVFNEFSSPEHIQNSFRQISPQENFSKWCPLQDNPTSQKLQRFSLDEIFNRPSIWNTTEQERRKLIDHWVSLFIDKAPDLLEQYASQYQEMIAEYRSLKQTSDLEALSSARIIGVTTTGLAKNINLLRGLTAKVVLCEEAGEVLEGHLLNSILPSCEHLILIGDHEQLRPQINQALELSMEFFKGIDYRLDESLFERLVHEDNNISPSQLGVQRRMRPNIADLVRETIYPELKDHPSVQKYPNVSGMQQNVFWLDHSHREAGIEDGSSSKSNAWEADMICGLVQHLIRQGCYRADDIAVLTPYLGQLQKLRRKLGEVVELSISDRDEEAIAFQKLADGDDSESEDTESHSIAGQRDPQTAKQTPLNKLVRLATVDNFQGEEAKIIIISFVRSNERRKIGFLKTKNRANVLLSRAKHGMYIIGNAQTAMNSEIWSEVCGILQQRNALGKKLYLTCPRHLDEPFAVTEPDDFIKYAPEGGCVLPCDRPLKCGHMCYKKCHANQIHHSVPCRELCTRLHEGCKHSCPKACNQDCGKCEVVIEEYQLKCGHTLENIPCHKIPNSKTEIMLIRNMEKSLAKLCREPCTKTHKGCKHPCLRTCNKACGNCEVVIEKHQLQCGHTLENTPCHMVPNSRTEVIDRRSMEKSLSELCQEPCTKIHEGCNHLCTERCGKSCGPCQVVLGNVELPCGHVMETVPCYKVPNSATGTFQSIRMLKALSNSCNKPCTKIHEKCNHLCTKKCSDKCGDCEFIVENVLLPCGHIIDKQPCHLASDIAKIECKAVVKNSELRCGHILKKVNCKGLEKSENHDLPTLIAGCKQPCQKVHPKCGHPCKKICSEACGKCRFAMKNFELPCGHLIEETPCYQTSNPTKIKCSVLVPKIWPGCNHEKKVECHVDPSIQPCTARCAESLNCGHQCTEICSDCFPSHFHKTNRVHRKDRDCKAMCGKPLPGCNHTCRSKCHGDTPCEPCSARCQTNCGHVWCTLACSATCNPCNKPCRWICKHLEKCSLPCSEPCNRQVCDKRCDKRLRCGHQCPTVCGEVCPARQYCQECCTEDIGSQEIASETYRSIDLNKMPVLILNCGHIFTRQTMDASVPLHDVYVYDEKGNILKTKDIPSDIKVPQCPKCSRPLQQFSVRRYGRVINSAVIFKQLHSYATTHEASLSKIKDILDREINNIGADKIESALQAQSSRDSRSFRDMISTGRSRTIPHRQRAIIDTQDGLRSEFRKLWKDAFPRTPPPQSALKWFSGHTSTDKATSAFGNRISRIDIHTKLLKVETDLEYLTKFESFLSRLPSDESNLVPKKVFKDRIEELFKASKECQFATEEAKRKGFVELEIEGHIMLSRLYAAFPEEFPDDFDDSDDSVEFWLLRKLCLDTLEGVRYARKLCDQFGLVDFSTRIEEQEVCLKLRKRGS